MVYQADRPIPIQFAKCYVTEEKCFSGTREVKEPPSKTVTPGLKPEMHTGTSQGLRTVTS